MVCDLIFVPFGFSPRLILTVEMAFRPISRKIPGAWLYTTGFSGITFETGLILILFKLSLDGRESSSIMCIKKRPKSKSCSGTWSGYTPRCKHSFGNDDGAW